MNVGLSIWDRLNRVLLILLVVAAVIAVIERYRPVVAENERMRQRKLVLEKQIQKETEIGKKLESSIKAMQEPRNVERMAREKLSYAKPGENVIHFDPPPTNAPVRAQ